MKPFRLDLWNLLDPLLLRVRSRLEHLEEFSPSRRREEVLASRANADPTVQFGEHAEIDSLGRPDRIAIGAYSTLFGELSLCTPEGRIEIGRYSFVGPRSRFWAAREIVVGNYVLIASGVDILDNNSHSSEWSARRNDPKRLFELKEPIDYSAVPTAPVRLEDDVWIALKATILKGVTIGRGAIVAANSVVTHDVPPFTLVGGSPARVLRELPSDGR